MIRWRPIALRLLIAGCLSVTRPTPSAGQDGRPTGAGAVPHNLGAVGARDLTFRTVFPGTPVSVSPQDPGRAGMFIIHGRPGFEVRLDFLLPNALRSPSGEILPMAFGPGDATFGVGSGPKGGFAFDPRTPVVAPLSPGAAMQVRLGGTVMPSLRQISGEYSATVTLTVFHLGT